MSYIYLIRHGQTRMNRADVFRGVTDVPLDEAGREQAVAVGKALKDHGVERIVASSLSRAAETAAIVSEKLGGVPVDLDRRLADIHLGEWQGLNVSQVQEKYPKLYEAWLTRPGEVVFPGGESMEKVAMRYWECLTEITKKYSGRTIAMIGHRITNKILLGWVIGAKWEAFWKIRQDTACLNVLSDEGGQLQAHLINDTCHLQTRWSS